MEEREENEELEDEGNDTPKAIEVIMQNKWGLLTIH